MDKGLTDDAHGLLKPQNDIPEKRGVSGRAASLIAVNTKPDLVSMWKRKTLLRPLPCYPCRGGHCDNGIAHCSVWVAPMTPRNHGGITPTGPNWVHAIAGVDFEKDAA